VYSLSQHILIRACKFHLAELAADELVWEMSAFEPKGFGFFERNIMRQVKISQDCPKSKHCLEPIPGDVCCITFRLHSFIKSRTNSIYERNGVSVNIVVMELTKTLKTNFWQWRKFTPPSFAVFVE
jgi:hypothetical protein